MLSAHVTCDFPRYISNVTITFRLCSVYCLRFLCIVAAVAVAVVDVGAADTRHSSYSIRITYYYLPRPLLIAARCRTSSNLSGNYFILIALIRSLSHTHSLALYLCIYLCMCVRWINELMRSRNRSHGFGKRIYIFVRRCVECWFCLVLVRCVRIKCRAKAYQRVLDWCSAAPSRILSFLAFN